MKFEFDEVFNPPPIVQNKKKYATFTVREIGGPIELARWKVEQELKWAQYQANRSAFKEKQKQFIAGPDAPQGDGVTWKGSGSILGAKDADWKDKLSHALSERKRLATPEILTARESWSYEEPPKPSLMKRFKQWIVNVWESANNN